MREINVRSHERNANGGMEHVRAHKRTIASGSPYQDELPPEEELNDAEPTEATVHYHRVPEDVYPARVEFSPHGRVDVYYRNGYITHQLNDYIQEKIRERMTPPSKGIYWRATDTPNEQDLLREGQLRNSHNYRDNTSEAGLSVSETPAYVFVNDYKYGYRVTGNVIGHGSDGEPLLDLATVQAVDKGELTHSKIKPIERQERKAHEEYLQSQGWTLAQYRSAIGKEWKREGEPPFI